MFMVGDRVVVVKNLLGGPSTFVGQRGVVNELSDEHFGIGVRTESYGTASFYPEELELIDMHSNQKFQVGDRVVVVGIDEANGRRGVVTKTDAHDYWPIEVRFGEAPGSLGLCREGELELESVYDFLSAPPADEESSGDSEVDRRHDFGYTGIRDEETSPGDEDVINSPSHYTRGKYEVIDIIEDSGVGYRLGNVLKYVLRADFKHDDNGVEDLSKALWYLKRELLSRGGSVD